MDYSILLLYPDYMQETGAHETYYAHVTAPDPDAAVEIAQAFKANEMVQPQDFVCLLVLEGHHQGRSFSQAEIF
jgi:hypothetical protein